MSLVDINKSDYGFRPDVANNQILFGLKALSGVNAEMIDVIKAGRPYTSIKDFMSRVKIKKTAMVSLIKGGAFDNIAEELGCTDKERARFYNMVYYLYQASEPKQKLTLQNLNGLIQEGMIPDSLDFEKKVYYFNKHLGQHKWVNKETNIEYYVIVPAEAYTFYATYFNIDYLEVIDGVPVIQQKVWKKEIYDVYMDKVRTWLKEHHDETLFEYNAALFKKTWEKYANKNNLSAWEMEALCFYYHDHELKNIDCNKYGIKNFFDYSSNPIVERYWKRGGLNLPIYELFRIAGTVISKNDTRHTVSLLTTDGVVPVKFTRDMYAMYKRQLSEVQPDGTKKVVEKGWFTRGTMLIINGFKRDDMFIAKKYANTQGHTIYKIDSIDEFGNIKIENERGQ